MHCRAWARRGTKARRDQSEDEPIESESQESEDSREESVHGTELAMNAGRDASKLDAEERASNTRVSTGPEVSW
jgi:hypothetical protein